MRSATSTFVVILLLIPCVFGCSLQFDPVALPHYYRADGWQLPGLSDANPATNAITYGLPSLEVLSRVPSAKAVLVPRDEDHYVLRIPPQEFVVGRAKQRTRPLLAKAVIVRWEVSGRTIAYTYSLIPISAAYKKDGAWTYEGEVGCIFDLTFIDDKGDGVFRLLVPGTLRPELIPAWVKASG